MLLSYLQPGADDDLTPGRRRMNWLWYHPVQCGRAARHVHRCGGPPSRGDSAAADPPRGDRRLPRRCARAAAAAIHRADRSDAGAVLPADLRSGIAAPGRRTRALLLGDAAFVARPHVGAGVTKAALNAAWLTDALKAQARYRRRRSPSTTRRRAPSVRRWWRGRAISAPTSKTRRAPGSTPDPVTLMQAIGVPLRDIPEVAATLG